MSRSATPPEIQHFIVPKAGSSREECEDAACVWAPAADSVGVPDGGNWQESLPSVFAAVSDGASESLLAGAWARQLVEDAVASMQAFPGWHEKAGSFIEELMGKAAGRWETYLAAYQADRAARERPIAWYEQPGLDKGAFATVLGVQVQACDGSSSRWRWHAFALGDSCLFQVRGGELVASFPIDDGRDFGVTPQLLGSRNRDTALVTDRVAMASGELRCGEELLLATDALSAWLLSADSSPGALGALADLGEEDVAEWVADRRTRGLMRNDDVAIIRLRVGAEV